MCRPVYLSTCLPADHVHVEICFDKTNNVSNRIPLTEEISWFGWNRKPKTQYLDSIRFLILYGKCIFQILIIFLLVHKHDQ